MGAQPISFQKVLKLFNLPFNDLLFRAHRVHRRHFDPNAVQLSQLINIKEGGCPENCHYCPQSAHFKTGVDKKGLMSLEDVRAQARESKAQGVTRMCLGAAWRSPRDADLEKVIQMIEVIHAEGLQSCVTLGMLKKHQAQRLKEAGLGYYNHNLDTSPEHYEKIVQTRTYQERLDTLANLREVGLNQCCGGIVGMGESREDRAKLLWVIATLPEVPKSVPINHLVAVEGTPLGEEELLDPFEFVRTIAVARILMPFSFVRLSAGRMKMNPELHALCFFAGANSIFHGGRLLSTGNPSHEHDQDLAQRLGIRFMSMEEVEDPLWDKNSSPLCLPARLTRLLLKPKIGRDFSFLKV